MFKAAVTRLLLENDNGPMHWDKVTHLPESITVHFGTRQRLVWTTHLVYRLWYDTDCEHCECRLVCDEPGVCLLDDVSVGVWWTRCVSAGRRVSYEPSVCWTTHLVSLLWYDSDCEHCGCQLVCDEPGVCLLDDVSVMNLVSAGRRI